MALVITSTTGAVTFADMTAGCTGVVGRYKQHFLPKGEKYEVQAVRTPGSDGSGAKHHGFEGRPFDITVIYVAASENDCHTAYEADQTTIGKGPCSIAVNGQTYPACYKKTFDVEKGAKPTSQNAMYRMICSLKFEQMRQT